MDTTSSRVKGNDVSFEKLLKKLKKVDASGKSVTLTSETREGVKLETFVPAGTFLHTAFVDYFTNTECKKKRWFQNDLLQNKYQISEISKALMEM